jgi:putative membrane protein (TIGR04086 family)
MRKRKSKELGLVALIMIGTAVGLGTIIATAFILALISSLTKDPTSLTSWLSLASLLISGAVSGFIISRANGEGGALVGISASVISAALLIIIGLIMSAGRLRLGVFINVIAYLSVAVFGSILGKKRIKRRRRKYS